MFPYGGPVLFGYCLDLLLYGILTVQIYIYYLAFPIDGRLTKAIVAFIYVIGTLQTAFALHDFYTLFCIPNSFKDRAYYNAEFPGDLRQFSFMWITIPLSGVSVSTVSQLFYAHRIHVLSGQKLMPGVIITLALLQLGTGMFVALAGYKNLGAFALQDMPTSLMDAWAWESSGAICDLVITIYMYHFLSRDIPRSFQPIQVSLTKIKGHILETGLLTTTTAVAYVMLSTFTGFNSFIIPGLCLSKIYANSILALLNGRSKIQGGRSEVDPGLHHWADAEQQPEL